jgi:hypothetical protein
LEKKIETTMKKLICTLIILFLATTAFAGTNGGLGGAFGRMGAGARAKALGNAYTGLAEGTSAIYFNPGALPFAKRREFSASASSMSLDRSMQYLAFVTPLHPKAGPDKKAVNAGVGIGWLHAGVGDIDSRDFDGAPLEKIDQSSNLFLFSFGIQLHERFGAGITAKVNYETYGKIADNNRSVNGNGFGVDVGLFAKPIDHLSVGAHLKDLGSKTTWSTTDYWPQGSSKTDKWPFQYQFGAAYNYNWLTGVADLEGSKEGETHLHLGAEAAHSFTEKQSVALRAGLDKDSFNAGVGLDFLFWKLKSKVDFTYTFEQIAPNDAQSVAWGIEF